MLEVIIITFSNELSLFVVIFHYFRYFFVIFKEFITLIPLKKTLFDGQMMTKMMIMMTKSHIRRKTARTIYYQDYANSLTNIISNKKYNDTSWWIISPSLDIELQKLIITIGQFYGQLQKAICSITRVVYGQVNV